MVPSAMSGDCGVIAMETSTAGVTVRAAEPVTDADMRLIVVAPGVSALARPWLPGVLETVASLPSLELQCPTVVRSCVLPSV